MSNPLLVALSVLTLAAVFPAQGDSDWYLLGRVRTDNGRAVAGAHLTFVPEPTHGIDWLRQIDPPAAPIEARSDAEGRFHFAVPAPTGSLLVERDDGLGALIARATAKTPLSIVVEPMAEVRRYDGEPLRAFVRALPRGERPFGLGLRGGDNLRLPAGRYLLLITDGPRRAEVRVDLHSGRREEIGLPDQEEPVIRAAPGTRVIADRWSEAGDLMREQRVPRLAGPVGWTWIEPQDGLLRLSRSFAEVPAPAPSVEAWRSLSLHVVDAAGSPARGARVIGVVLRDGGVSPCSDSTADATGIAPLALLPGSTFAVILAEGCVPAAVPMNLQDAAGKTIALEAAVDRRVRIVDEDHAPVRDAVLEIDDAEHGVLRRSFRSDAEGFVVLPRVRDSVVRVRIDSGRHLPRETDLAPRGAAASIEVIELASGAALHGRVVLGEGRPAAEVDVELREPSARTGLEPRFTLTDSDGRFVFTGLPDSSFTLFASAAPGGITWSAQRVGATPGPDEWTLLLRCEDPERPDRGR